MTLPPASSGLSWAEAGLGPAALQAAQEAVGPLRERLGLDAVNAPYEAQRWTGFHSSQLPTLQLDDVSAIPFLVDIPGVEEYQHRACLRARAGDLFAAVTPISPGFQEYCRDVLRLGETEFVRAKPFSGPMAVARACAHGEAFQRIVSCARQAGGLGVHPYMGIEAVWDLARRVAHEASVPVAVLAPPPPVTWVANDKALFSETVVRVLGPPWVVETRSAWEPGEMAAHLLELGSRHRRVGLKRTRCASGMGNVIYDLVVLGLPEPGDLEARVRSFLQRTEWAGDEEVLIVAWEDASHSPSTQLWIPPREAGPPRLDGVYEQILTGKERVFVGSRPSGLPDELNRQLGIASLQVAAALQELGYVGCCSFDLLVLGDPLGDYKIRFTECNGRWGGTSSPMHLVDRVVPGPRPPYRAQDYIHPDLVGVPFSEILQRVGDEVYHPARGTGRFIFYNVGPLAASGKLDVVALGATQSEAEFGLLELLPRLLGLSGDV